MSFQIRESLNNTFYSSQINVFSFFHFEQFLTITEVLSFLKPRIQHLGLFTDSFFPANFRFHFHRSPFNVRNSRDLKFN